MCGQAAKKREKLSVKKIRVIFGASHTPLYERQIGHRYAGHKKEDIIVFFFIFLIFSHLTQCTR